MQLLTTMWVYLATQMNANVNRPTRDEWQNGSYLRRNSIQNLLCNQMTKI